MLTAMHAGHLIREARRRAGLTQAELAKRLNTAQPNVARWESASMSPSMDTMTRIISACGLDLLVRLVDQDSAQWTPLGNSESAEERLEKLVTFVDLVEEGRPAAQENAVNG